MKRLIVLTVLACFSFTAVAEKSSYAGQESRSIKALSPQKISGLLAGEGLGYAKVAELNGYPGPAHVLELADELKLSDEQMTQTQELFAVMNAQAKELGADLVETEKQLELAFASGNITENKVTSFLETIGSIEGKLRAVHVNAHLAQKLILTPHQIHKYNKIRGYGSKHHHEGHHNH